MIPHLVKSDAAEGLAGPSEAPLVPPLHFRILKGPVTNIRLRLADYTTANGLTASQKNGLRYERKVQAFLQEKFGKDYHPAPWLHFEDDGVARTVQPDGVLLRMERLYVFEIKFQHMPEAWWQLEKLYAPLLRKFFPTHQVSCVEVCRSYDPSTPFPCEVKLIPDLDSWIGFPRSDFGVFQWRG